MMIKSKFILITVIIAIVLVAAIIPSKSFLRGYLSERQTEQKLKDLIKRDYLYLEKEELVGASFNKEVFISAKTTEDEYLILRIVRATLENGQFSGNSVIELPNGELYSGASINGKLPELILGDGSLVQGLIVDNALTLMKIGGERLYQSGLLER
jgi:hypothetical protein